MFKVTKQEHVGGIFISLRLTNIPKPTIPNTASLLRVRGVARGWASTLTGMQTPLSLVRIGRLALVAVLMSLLGCAVAPDPALQSPMWIQAQGWRIDQTGQARLQDAQAAADWQDFKGWRRFGYGPEPIWGRVLLRAAEAGTGTPLVVRVRPAFLDHLTLYDPMAQLELHTGDAMAPSDDDLGSIDFGFHIPALSQDRDIYLRLESTSSRSIHVEVLPDRLARQKMQRQEGLFGFLLSISAVFATWAAIQWWQTRDRVMGLFALKQLVSTLWAFFFLGFAQLTIGPWLAPGVLTAVASALIPLSIGSVLWFMATLLQAYQPSKHLLRMCFTLAGALALMPLLQWAGLTRASLMICSASVPVAVVMLFTTLLSAPRRTLDPPPIPKLYMQCYLGVYGVFSALPPAVYLGWIEKIPVVLLGNLNQAMFDGLMMFFILQFRSKALKHMQQQAELELARSHEQAAVEKRQREETSQLFSMLAHEMRTPLATLHMWMEAGQLNSQILERAIADMNRVIERCVHSDQLSDRGLQPVYQCVDALAVTQATIGACRAPQRVDFVSPDGPAILPVDTQMLSIILVNVLDNACKYGRPESRVQVVLEPWVQGARAGWRWHVSNQIGPVGLPDAQRLFDKYYRSTQARRQSGSGLGLFLVKALLDLMHGTITYEPGNMQLSFNVWLPAEPTWC